VKLVWRKRLRKWSKQSLIALASAWLLHELVMAFTPLPGALLKPQLAALRFVDRRGEPLRFQLARNCYHHQRFTLDECPQHFLNATLSAEDKRFWSHGGVDLLATFRAARDYAARGRVVSGASTITQQLIKIAQPRNRTLAAKISECLSARKLERRWSKRRILEEYLNRLDYGNSCRGAATASWYYFNKSLVDLSPAEGAFLAGLPNAPSRLNPKKHPERARQRQRLILDRMLKNGWLDSAMHLRALAERIILKCERSFAGAHFVDHLKQQQALPSEGVIHTTLDLALTRRARHILRDHLDQLKDLNVSNGAVVIIENATGDLIAMVGSRDYFSPKAGQVNGAWAERSPGSTLKPFTYLLAFEHGATPATVVADVPTDFPTSTGIFTPHNYNRRFHGPMRLRIALANSLNVSAVKVLKQYSGPRELQSLLQKCGLNTLEKNEKHYGLGLTLGNAEARLVELANAYACLARLGQHRPLRLRRSDPSHQRQLFNRTAAWWVADILSDNNARARSFGLHSSLEFNFPVACKTGTSSDFRDNWAFGYTPKYTVGIWVGNFDGSPMREVSGVTGAAPIMHDLMEFLHHGDDHVWYRRPEGLNKLAINEFTGKCVPQSGTSKPNQPTEWLLLDQLPPMQTSGDFIDGRILLGPEYARWIGSLDNHAPTRLALKQSSKTKAQLLFPLPGTVLIMDPDLPESSSILDLRLNIPANAHWSSRTLECFVANGQAQARLQPGRHEIIALVDGRRLTTWVEVRAR